MERTELEERYAKARRELIARDFGTLNDMQLQAALTTEGPLLLLAGAGSGKTTVLINRIVNLIRYGRGSDSPQVPSWVEEEDLELLEDAVASGMSLPDNLRPFCALEPVEPWRILAITFTNKAADELKTRLERALGEGSRDIWAMTFHSACVRILRRSIEPLGYSKSFTVYDAADSQAVMKRVMKELDIDEKQFPVRAVLTEISRAKDALLGPEAYADEAMKTSDLRKKITAKAYLEYAKRLKNADALDFDDLIFLTVRLFEQYPETADFYRRQFRYILVDEYQDTSLLQYRLCALLAEGRENICVVGDDDQSIYRFRGATIENILSFEDKFRSARVIKLEQNYRSTGHILGAANGVIEKNTGRKGKVLWTLAGDGEKPLLYEADNEDEEAEYVASQILTGVTQGLNFRDFAVLYRMNAQSNRLEFAMKRHGIPYKVIGGMKFFDRTEVKDITSYLCTVQNPSDDLRLLRIINVPARGIGGTTVETVRDAAVREGVSIFRVLENADRYPELSRSAGRLKDFAGLITGLGDAARTMPLDEFYDYLLDKTGYVAALGTSDDALARIDNLGELKNNIVNYISASEDPSLAGFLDEIALYTDLDSLEQSDNAVILMTMHAAKGLEFSWVFVVGMEDGIFPSLRSIGDQEEMEEERRLCYVALTRARTRLFLTAARQRMLFGRTSSNLVSRFVEEIPPEHLERPEARPQRTSYSQYTRPAQGYGQGYGGYAGRERSSPVRTYRAEPEHRPAPRPTPRPAAPQAKPLLSIAVGDRVQHKAFGAGTVSKMTPMAGGDALVVIAFDEKGEKKLMLKTAGAFMTKLGE